MAGHEENPFLEQADAEGAIRRASAGTTLHVIHSCEAIMCAIACNETEEAHRMLYWLRSDALGSEAVREV